ncbi:MAG: hypothetical protein HS105_05840 [Chloracidobacterium sp.]|nr:hypothetical protein [Chloracidobacterium sp.]
MTNAIIKIMNVILTIFFALGGADFNVLRESSSKTKRKYFAFSIGLLGSVGLAFIGGADVANHYIPEGTDVKTQVLICIAAGLLWSILVFSYDFGIMNVDGLGVIGKIMRVVSGIAAVFLTVTALITLMTQTKIDNRINATKVTELKAVDTRYLSAKETRYKLVNDKKAHAEKYNLEVVQTEANRGYPGPRYNEKKAAYDAMINDVNSEILKLESLEAPFFESYQSEREEIQGRGSGDFLIKVETLFSIISEGGIAAILIVTALYTIFGAFEMGVLALKATTSENDEYHEREKQYNTRMAPILLEAAQAEADLKRDRLMLAAQKGRGDFYALKHDADMLDLNDSIVKEAEIRGKMRILRNKGYHANADALEAELQRLPMGRNAA